jgi:hypothetical protein
MSFFENLLGTAIRSAVGAGTKALVQSAFTPSRSVQIIGAAGTPAKKSASESALESVLRDADIKSGFVGEVPSVGGILTRRAGVAEPAVSTRTNANDIARMIVALKSPQVAEADATELMRQIKAPSININASARRQKKSLRKLFQTR